MPRRYGGVSSRPRGRAQGAFGANNIGRVDVSEPASISAGIAARYATAIFEIAKENKDLKGLETGINDLAAALGESADLRNLIASPLVSRAEQEAAITAIAKKMKLGAMLANSLGLMAQKRRLFVLPQLLKALKDALAEERGEVTADVTSAKALTKTQIEKLTKTLSERVGKSVTINATVDESLIGGLVVKVGSKMIDSSIRSKLNSLQNAMKEVG
ncbi:ATP synthase F1 subcomplex delta subunit [Ruegeria marina]|uniref:ATP synthase subunit delta n=1 Tax=Ruegeria marina TaxID=639004 RepID=A0A1G6QYV8_9RHOB|nr:ATP synthase F1 subcomplex delta subunit [Ruegeria marina]